MESREPGPWFLLNRLLTCRPVQSGSLPNPRSVLYEKSQHKGLWFSQVPEPEDLSMDRCTSQKRVT